MNFTEKSLKITKNHEKSAILTGKSLTDTQKQRIMDT